MIMHHLQELIDTWCYNAKRTSQTQIKIKKSSRSFQSSKPIPTEMCIHFTLAPVEPLLPTIILMKVVTFGYEKSKIIFIKCFFQSFASFMHCNCRTQWSGKDYAPRVDGRSITTNFWVLSSEWKIAFAFFMQPLWPMGIQLFENRFKGYVEFALKSMMNPHVLILDEEV